MAHVTAATAHHTYQGTETEVERTEAGSETEADKPETLNP
jgi:hypothetical protein